MSNPRLSESVPGGAGAVAPGPVRPSRDADGSVARQTKKLMIFLVALVICFAKPLFGLVMYSVHSQFFSYILLIPFISVYLIKIKRTELPTQASMSGGAAALMALPGLALVLSWFWGVHAGWWVHAEDQLTIMTAAFALFVAAGCLLFLGTAFTKAIVFPLSVLIFMIPMPPAMLDAVTIFFQLTSAAAAEGMLRLAMMPVFRQGINLNLPGYVISVDPECSGIHSTMVLLITGVLAGNLFLRSQWKRAFLILFVIPLAILRNGFRIFVISEMCVQISHDMINSPVHKQGGPLFFALSLIPFFLVLYFLRKTEPPVANNVDATVKA